MRTTSYDAILAQIESRASGEAYFVRLGLKSGRTLRGAVWVRKSDIVQIDIVDEAGEYERAWVEIEAIETIVAEEP